ncbi:MAG: exonuclease SbcCD subunit D [Rhodothermales bacterium]
MQKFLHLADVHLDSTFLCRSERLRARLRKELRASLRRAIDLAIQEKVTAVLIAGDLVEEKRLSVATESFLLEQFERLHLAQIPCIYVAGDVDPGVPTSKTLEMSWPESFLHIKTRSPKVIELQDVDGTAIARIVGVGHELAKEKENLALRFPMAQEDVPYIGVLHTKVESAKGAELAADCAPSQVTDLRKPGYTYWALGHIHQSQSLKGVPNAWYAGNMVGTSAEDSGIKGGLLVAIDDNREVKVTFKAFSSVRWYDLSLHELHHVKSVDDLSQLAELAFEFEADGSESIAIQLVRIRLSGMCPMANELLIDTKRAVIEEKLAQHLNVDDVELRVNFVTPLVDVDIYREDSHLLSEVLKVIEEVSADPELLDDIAPDQLAQQLSSTEDRQAYLSSLLNALDREAVVRLTHEVNHAN